MLARNSVPFLGPNNKKTLSIKLTLPIFLLALGKDYPPSEKE
jgi:hypothetical protein